MQAIKDNSAISVVEVDTEARANTAVNAAIDVFAIEQGHVTVPQEVCPLEALFTTLRKISEVFELNICSEVDLNCRKILHRLLQSIFDTDTQSFLEQETSEIFAHLSSKQKARILAQAIATFTILFQRLAETGETVSYGVLNREAQLFAESDQRSMMQNAIEENPVFENCEKKSDIADAILAAIDAEESPEPLAVDDKLDFNFSPSAALEHSSNTMGQPFTIMALN
ncbi:hypothetical protein FALBO_14405 [Fusarium albosuccineum]|uniref:Uncharacterized protein n=1 Tax=Fusarium albosuccineum TaxID=1237068 RepID=A0A8H4P7D0_9HYPO|nr:hypothetical protein FALBO_14405 [Fusarium albosuccineum]